MRLKFNEINPARIISGINRRIIDIPDMISWHSKSNISIENKDGLLKFSEIHNGQRCFLIANGPSLKKMDISPLKNEIVIGMNRIYLLTNKIDLHLDYYICMNELVLEQFRDEIIKLNTIKF